MKKLYPLLALTLLMYACRSWAQGTMSVRIVKEGLFIPWEILYGPDGLIWLTQKNGYICRLHPATGLLDTLYHETAVVIRSEGGMTGLALHPDFPAAPYVYAAHNYLVGTAYRVRVMRYTYNGSNALGSPILMIDGINGSFNHNGCRLLAQGDKLFITTGDGETPSSAQNLQSRNGKVLRINLDGSIPTDNPFPGSPVWSWGHRNAQGLVAARGKLYSSEHGPSNDDEINVIEKGRNFGWPAVSGFCDLPAEQVFCNDSNVAQPVKAWTPTLAVCGMDYYSHPMFPDLQGSMLLTTLKDQRLYQLRLNPSSDVFDAILPVTAVSYGRLRDLCISPTGRIYISTSNSPAGGTGAFTDRIIELSDPAFTGIAQPGRLALRIYPNPVKETLFVGFGSYTEGEYRVLDIGGRQVMRGKIDGALVRLPIAGLVAGHYLLQVTADGATGEGAFLKRE